jgi:hypothetical protein
VAEHVEERSVGSVLAQIANDFQTGAAVTAGGLAVKGAVDKIKAARHVP